MLIKCYNKTYNKALRDSNLKGLLITTNCKELAMTTANNTRNIERGQSCKSKLIHGFGLNSKRNHKASIKGRKSLPYKAWSNMIQRCYSTALQKKNPTYLGCTVAEEWRDFQDFADWYYNHDYSSMGYHLDKDILIPNNKIYSSGTCCFVPAELNSLLNNHGLARGGYPQGVIFNESAGNYRSRLNINGSQKHLGYFDCSNEAHQAYRLAKEAYVKEKALEWQDRIADNVFQALMNWTLDC